MAIKKIKGNEFVEQNFFKNYVDSAEKAKQVTKGLVEAIKGISKETKTEIKAFSPKTLQDVEKFYASTKKAREEINLLEKAEKKLLIQEKELNALKTDEKYKRTVVASERLRQEKAALTRQTREEVKNSRKLESIYSRQSRTLNNLRKKYKDTALSLGENSKQAKRLLAQIKPLDKALKKVDNTVGQNQRSVGKYANALKGFAGQLGLFVGVAAAFRLVKDSINIVKNFEKQVATTAGVLGITKDEASALADESKRLGSITEFTAAQVGGLQEAYARLGFTQEEIIGVTEATLRGATALQSDLGESAALVGSTLNQFKLGAEDSSRVVDILAKSTQISALNFSKLQTALPVVGKTAEVAGVSLERTSAMLGVLSSNGIDASTSATALRNIFIEVAKRGITLEQAYAKINGSTDKLSTATELFGKRGATVSLTLAESIEKTNEYNEALLNADGTAAKLAETQLNTLDGALKILNSAWQGYILNLNDATNGGNLLTKGIRFLSDNLVTIINTIGLLIGSFLSYKLVILAVNLAQKIATGATVAYRIAVVAMNGGIGKAIKSIKLLRIALATSGIGLAVVAIGALAAAIYGATEATDENTISTDENTKAQKRLNDKLQIQNDLRNSVQGIEDRIATIDKLGKDQLKSLEGDIKSEISLNKKKNAEILAEDVARNRGINSAREEALERLRKSTKLSKLSESELLKVRASSNVDLQVYQSLTKDLNEDNKDYNKLAETSISNQVKLNKDLALVQGKISNFKDSSVGGGGGKKRLTQLGLLKKKLKEVNTLREKLLVDPSDKLSPAFIKATAKANKLKEAIEQYQNVLSGKKRNEGAGLSNIKTKDIDDGLEDRTAKKDKEIADKEAVDRIVRDELERDSIESAAEKKAAALANFDSISARYADMQSKRSQDRVSDIDDEITAMQSRANTLRTLADQGSLTAKQSLALLAKQEAEATLKKEKELQKQKKIEAGLALLRTYSASLAAGNTPTEALKDVVTSGAMLSALVASLPSFYDGTEDTGTVNGALDSKGGRLSVLHDNERVVNKKNNQHLKGISNDELGTIGQLYKSGDLFNNKEVKAIPVSMGSNNNEAMEKLGNRLESAIKSIPSRSFEFDRVEKVVTEITQIRNKTERTKRKINI